MLEQQGYEQELVPLAIVAIATQHGTPADQSVPLGMLQGYKQHARSDRLRVEGRKGRGRLDYQQRGFTVGSLCQAAEVELQSSRTGHFDTFFTVFAGVCAVWW